MESVGRVGLASGPEHRTIINVPLTLSAVYRFGRHLSHLGDLTRILCNYTHLRA